MAKSKKDFTKADGVIDRIFQHAKYVGDEDVVKHAKDTYIAHDTKHTYLWHVSNKSKHYDSRGPRKERFGLLMDGQLKNDLADLARATGSRSVNDLIITVLLDYVEGEGVQRKLAGYRDVLGVAAIDEPENENKQENFVYYQHSFS